MTTIQKNELIGHFLNGSLFAIKSIIPISFQPSKPSLLKETLQIKYGVLIGFAGDIKGKLVFKGEPQLFNEIGQKMYGMPLEGDMLSSFTGELGNMITGTLSVYMSEHGTSIDITPPTVMEGEVNLSGFENAISVTVNLENAGSLQLYMLIDH